MTLKFIKEMNEAIIESTLEASDEEILSTVGKEGYPTQDDLDVTKLFISNAIEQNRKKEKRWYKTVGEN